MMKRKHTTALICMAVLVLMAGTSFADAHVFPAEPMAVTEGSITRDDAIAIAEQELVTREGLVLNDFQNYKIKAGDVRLETGEEAWVVMLDEQLCGTDALVTIAAADGAILDYQATNMEIMMVAVNQWTEKMGAMNAWPVEKQALFDWLYGSSDEYIVPTDAYISQDEAGAIALSAVGKSASSVTLLYAFKRFSYTDGRPEQYVWLITVQENGKETYVLHISATDGTVLELFKIGKNG